MWIKKLFGAIIIISCSFCCRAQDKWPSPEVEQMYQHAKEYLSMGNLDAAINTYQQLLTFVPTNTHVSAELGIVYYLKGNYEQAQNILEPLTVRQDASDTVFQLLASAQAAQKDYKEAQKTIEKGVSKFPKSGLLYYQRGLIFAAQNKQVDAASAWADGTVANNEYAPNYKSLALAILGSDLLLEALTYGEEYLAMKHDTAGDDEFKSTLYKGWGYFMAHMVVPDSERHEICLSDMTAIYKQLTPVVSDGISTENLTMLRTRFLMQWEDRPVHKVKTCCTGPMAEGQVASPAISEYQNTLLRDGWFDIYNQWLWGKAENIAQYEAWNKFHEGDMARFLQWQSEHYFVPSEFPDFLPLSYTKLKSALKKKKR